MKWLDYLNNEAYIRLCECRTIKDDLPILVEARWRWLVKSGKAEQGWTKEDALVFVLDLLDSNNITWVWDLTKDEYNALKN